MNRLLIIPVILLSVISLTGCVEKIDEKGNVIRPTLTPTIPLTAIPVSDKLIIEDIVVGSGTEAKNGNTLKLHYKGTLTDGTEFDNSYKRNEPFSFQLGSQGLISGWNQGIQGMKVGGKRKITIPAELGYGNQQQGTIPANSTLIFEVELIEVQ